MATKKVTKATKTVVEEVKKVVVKNENPDVPVYDGETVVRTYCLSGHGEQYKKLAEEFAARHGYTVRYE